MNISKNIAVVLVALNGLVFSCMNSQALAESSVRSSLITEQQQPGYNPLAGPNYPLVQDSYFTDDGGNILMIVNVLGEVNRQGQLVVRENVDFATILALAGGLQRDANLKKVLVARQEPDKNGVQAYVINLKEYYKHGDRSSFIALKPNDTIIFPEKGFNFEKLSQMVGLVYPWAYIYSNLKN
jgi:hypothetical protein